MHSYRNRSKKQQGETKQEEKKLYSQAFDCFWYGCFGARIMDEMNLML